ncbi:MAG TPA: condensation domain-containing protein, partial [Kofleriaceae bacterium]
MLQDPSAGPANAGTAAWPLRRNQQEIYLEQLRYPDSGMFNIAALVRIEGPLQVAVLQRAIDEVYARQPGMRGVVIERDGVPLQAIAPSSPPTTVVDFSGAADPDRALQQYVTDDLARRMPFGEHALLGTAQIVVLGPTRFVVYAKYHHIAFDGWSTSLFHQHALQTYNELVAGEPVTLTGTHAWADSIAADHEYVASEQYQRDKTYWQQRLSDEAPRLFPARDRGLTSERHSVFIPRATFAQIQQIANGPSFTPFHFLLAVFTAWLGRIGRSSDIPVGLPILGRRTAAERRTVGFYATMLPVRVQLTNTDTVASLTRQIGRNLKRDYGHNRFPQADLRRPGQHAGPPFEVSLSYEEHNYGQEFAGCQSYVDVQHPGAQVPPIKAYVRVFAERHDVRLDIDVNRACFDVERARAMPGELLRMIEAAIAAPDAPLARLPLLDIGERLRLTRGSAPPVELAAPRSLVDWFDATAAEHPERPTVLTSDGACSLDYRGLAAAARRLARHLRGRGVTSETRVGLCLEREPDLVVAV